jgi:N-acetylmuramoyl-L-alanine amidase
MAVEVVVFHDDTSTTQSENLATIVNFHNEQERDLDVSVHFNAYVETDKAMGVEVLYLSQAELAAQVAAAIASCGFKNRGAKKRTDLYFLNKTDMPAILIEVCFVDSQADADLYNENFDRICSVIAGAIAGDETDTRPQPEPPSEPDAVPVLEARGKVSHFGGSQDTGVSPSEQLAF